MRTATLSLSLLSIAWVLSLCLATGCVEDMLANSCANGDGEMVHLTDPGRNLDFYIDKYEASRTDASDLNEGGRELRACSREGVLPWRRVSFQGAQSACAAVGKRLCTREEWVAACQSFNQENVYSYGGVFRESFCNYNGQNADIVPTGFFVNCRTRQEVFDLNGNVREWVLSDDVGGRPELFGGSYSTGRLEVDCLSSIRPSDPDTYEGGQGDGFRCCR